MAERSLVCAARKHHPKVSHSSAAAIAVATAGTGHADPAIAASRAPGAVAAVIPVKSQTFPPLAP